jgi:alkylation response protein AidB-like acyl-CoA dehydrogenase
MDPRLTEDQVALAENVRDYLAGVHGPETLRRLDAAGGRDPAIWNGLVEMGLTGVCVPEEAGGLGLGVVEAALVAVECGRACLAEPLVDTALVGAPWLVRHGRDAELAELAAGRLKAALAHPVNPWIADLDQADVLVAGGKLTPAGELPRTPLPTIDPLRRLFRAPAGLDADPYLLDLAALMSAAQLLGLAEAMLAQATEYAKVRQQFGQPIGAFQAIKHHLASALTAIEFVRPLLWRAAAALEANSAHAPAAVSHAKLAAGAAAIATAETAIQTHGAMGYTYEVDLHFWMKRSWALAGAWGDRALHLARLDAAVIGDGMPIGPEHTFV